MRWHTLQAKIMRNLKKTLILVLTVTAATALPLSLQADQNTLVAPPSVVPSFDPKFKKISADFCKFYSSLRTFQVNYTGTSHVADNDGNKSMEWHYAVTMERPNSFAIIFQSGTAAQSAISNGKTMVVYQPSINKFSSIPVRMPMNLMVDEGGFFLGLSPLMAVDPEETLLRGACGGIYVGQEQIDGITTYRLRLLGPTSTAMDLWIATGETPFLMKAECNTLKLTSTFSNWKINITISPDTFVFIPPAGATPR